MKDMGIIKMTGRGKRLLFTMFLVFCMLVLSLTSYLNYNSLRASSEILGKSIQTELLSVVCAACEIIDENAFFKYNDPKDIDNGYYTEQLANLQSLTNHTNTKSIYAIKQIDNVPVVIFDTAPNAEPFKPYRLSEVHEDAFFGRESSGLSNNQDETGNLSTGAVPIRRNGKIIGIMCADVEDTLLIENRDSAWFNLVLMLALLALTLGVLSVLVYLLLGRIKRMQDRLKHMANYDKLTNLPNRQFLMDHLADITTNGRVAPFALLFIDLDNFKKVNDSAGHDAGDALLVHISNYLSEAQRNSQAPKPGSGIAARIGGDEFILIVPGIASADGATAFAGELLTGFGQQQIDRYIEKYQVGLSIGIALFPYHADDCHALIKCADMAMYHAKAAGKNCSCVYEESMQDQNGQ